MWRDEYLLNCIVLYIIRTEIYLYFYMAYHMCRLLRWNSKDRRLHNLTPD